MWRCVVLMRLISVLILMGVTELALSQETACMRQVAAQELAIAAGGRSSGEVDAGERVALRLVRGGRDNRLAGPASSWMRVTVLDNGSRVRELSNSFYLDYAYLKSGKASFWMIGEFTGGMHCCARYHFFTRTTERAPLHYLGTTAGSSEGMEEEPFICRDGAIYFKDSDIRFLYFHTPYARSVLAIPSYYRLDGTALSVDNRPFKSDYLEAARGVDDEFAAALRARTVKPASLLRGDDSAFFVDEAAQLLVKRTILYLFAREEGTAWATFERDAGIYYGSNNLELIKPEIENILKEAAY